MLNLRASLSALCLLASIAALSPVASADSFGRAEPPILPCPPVSALTDTDDLPPSVPPGAPAASMSDPVDPPIPPCPPVAR